MDAKRWYQSKTVWTNVGAVVTALGAWAQAGFTRDGVTLYLAPALLGVANVVLRWVTRQPIE
jgi:hypothetical protein